MKATPNDNAAISAAQLALCGVQLALLSWLCRFFEIGSESFVKIMLLTVPAFLVHALLPLRFRLGWYLAVSLAGAWLVLGAVDAFWLVLIVCGFVGICHLPVRLVWRVLALVAAGGAFAYLKAIDWNAPWSYTAWPIIASILMFRLVIYLYDLHHEKGRPPIAWSLSYFFLLPNVCFPLFPVVDFRKFRSTYYSEPAALIYKRGLSWIFRGIYQLILYRVVYQFLVISPDEVLSTAQLLQFMLSAYLLYLRVSGLFHLIVGVLLLFGFNLPETHKKYYLASSFNDFWRRINIYWKDFMMKIFYYPVYFKVKKLGPTPALVIATIAVFFCTWALHAYQWFWIRGTLLFEVHDLLFWAVLGVLVVFNSLREIKHGRSRTTGTHALLSLGTFAHACRVISTFSALCILWSMWSSDSFMQWLLMWRAAGVSAVLVAAVVPVFFLLARWAEKRSVAAPSTARRQTHGLPTAAKLDRRPRPAATAALAGMTVLSLVALVAASWSSDQEPSNAFVAAASRIRTPQLNSRDEARMQRGYYEHLLNFDRHSDVQLASLEREPDDWINLDDTEAAVHPRNFLITELLPNHEIMFKDASFRTNRWGMRDDDYDKEKPPDTIRIAQIGTSHALGSGVTNDQVFEHLLENKLNSDVATDAQRYEILNFAMAAYSTLQQLYALDNKVRDFQPDIVVHYMLEGDESFILRNLSMAIRDDIEVPYDYVRAIIDRLGLKDSDTDEEIRAKLAPFVGQIQTWADKQLIATIKDMRAEPICVFLPKVQVKRPSERAAKERQHDAIDAGCYAISLFDVYNGYTQEQLRVAPWDNHPNALGHKLIAARLYKELTSRRELLSSINPESVSRN